MNDLDDILYLIRYLLDESGSDIDIPEDTDRRFWLYRSLVNVRPPHVTNSEYAETERRFLEKAAAENGLDSIAFCCISTGVFGYPQKEAAKTAVDTVKKFLAKHDIKVIFNVFKDEDMEIYKNLL